MAASASASMRRDEWEIKATYERYVEIHSSGHCSDPDEINTDKTTITRRYPCPKGIKKSDVDGDMNIINPDIIDKYRITKHTTSGCNGYCGCYTTYYTIRVQIVRKVDFPFE